MACAPLSHCTHVPISAINYGLSGVINTGSLAIDISLCVVFCCASRLLRCGLSHPQLRLVGVCNCRDILVSACVLVAEGKRSLSASFHFAFPAHHASHHRQPLPLSAHLAAASQAQERRDRSDPGHDGPAQCILRAVRGAGVYDVTQVEVEVEVEVDVDVDVEVDVVHRRGRPIVDPRARRD